MNSRIALRPLLLLLFLSSTAVCVTASAHDRDDHRYKYRSEHVRTYQHIYYPAYRSYYSPHSRTWFWLSGSRWYSGTNLPFGIDVQIGGIPISLNTAIPYYEHRYVETRYAQPIYVIRHQGRHREAIYRGRDEYEIRPHGRDHQRW